MKFYLTVLMKCAKITVFVPEKRKIDPTNVLFNFFFQNKHFIDCSFFNQRRLLTWEGARKWCQCPDFRGIKSWDVWREISLLQNYCTINFVLRVFLQSLIWIPDIPDFSYFFHLRSIFFISLFTGWNMCFSSYYIVIKEIKGCLLKEEIRVNRNNSKITKNPIEYYIYMYKMRHYIHIFLYHVII